MASVPINSVDTQRIADAAYMLEFLERTNQNIKLETTDNAIAQHCNRSSITREINRIKERYPNLWNIRATETESPETASNRANGVALKEYEKWKDDKAKKEQAKNRNRKRRKTWEDPARRASTSTEVDIDDDEDEPGDLISPLSTGPRRFNERETESMSAPTSATTSAPPSARVDFPRPWGTASGIGPSPGLGPAPGRSGLPPISPITPVSGGIEREGMGDSSTITTNAAAATALTPTSLPPPTPISSTTAMAVPPSTPAPTLATPVIPSILEPSPFPSTTERSIYWGGSGHRSSESSLRERYNFAQGGSRVKAEEDQDRI